MSYLSDFHNPDTAAQLYVRGFLESTANSLCCEVEDIVRDFRTESTLNYMDDIILNIHLELCTVNNHQTYSVQDTLFIDHHTIANDTIKSHYKEEFNIVTMLLDKINQLIEPRVNELKELNAGKIKAKEKADWDATTKTRLNTYIKPSIYKDESLHH